MNIFKNAKLISICIILFCMIEISCNKSYLDEYNPSNRTTTTYYNNAAGFEALTTSCYPLMRDITQQRYLTINGTDMFCNATWPAIYYGLSNPLGSQYDQYDTRLNASAGEIQTLWDYLYREINRCNSVMYYAPGAVGESDSLKTLRKGEATFLRSLCLFWAVQQWGDIPMPLTPSQEGTLSVTKTLAKDVYTQIIGDLTNCVNVLPAAQNDVGRVTKGAAKFLLARVYLTRGWNYNNSLGGSAADFTSALALCDQIIASGLYPLESNWNNLWPAHNKNPNVDVNISNPAASVATCNVSKEVIWAIQYANSADYQGDPSNGTTLIGNNMRSQFGGGPSGVAQQARTSTYNRWNGINQPTFAAYLLFDPTLDTRYEGTFTSVTYATTAGSVSLASNNPNPQNITLTYKVSDTTAICLPWNNPATTTAQFGKDIPGGTKNYSVANVNQYGVGLGYINGTQGVVNTLNWSTPMFWKFFQPGVTYGDGYSTFNDPLFRSAEVYLMAAEAIVQGGTGAQLGTADVYYNKVLDRALGANSGKSPVRPANISVPSVPVTSTVSYRATAANITIDMILDERARELMGEGDQRWYDLKRTATLISRGTKYNAWTGFGLNGTPLIAAKHYLRPIPIGMINNTSPTIDQNPGY